MDPATGGAIAAVGAGAARVLGALIGRAIAQGDYEKAEALQRQAMEQYGTIDPDALAKIDVEQQGTEADRYVEDPEAQQAQLLALRRLGEMANGQSPEDDAAYARSQSEAGNFERGIRQAAMRRLQERGVGGNSGLAVAAQLNGAQMATQQKSQADLDTAAEARRRALAALGQYGGLAGNIRGQNYGQARDRAAAQDAINRFNAGQRYSQARDTFGMQMDLANTKAGQYGRLADRYDAYGNATQQAWAGAGDAVGGAFDSANPLNGEKKKK